MPISVVVKPFRYSADGINSELLSPGRKSDFGTSTKGLTDEKFIEPTRGEKTVAVNPDVATETVVVDTPAVDESVVETKPHGKKKTR